MWRNGFLSEAATGARCLPLAGQTAASVDDGRPPGRTERTWCDVLSESVFGDKAEVQLTGRQVILRLTRSLSTPRYREQGRPFDPPTPRPMALPKPTLFTLASDNVYSRK